MLAVRHALSSWNGLVWELEVCLGLRQYPEMKPTMSNTVLPTIATRVEIAVFDLLSISSFLLTFSGSRENSCSIYFPSISFIDYIDNTFTIGCFKDYAKESKLKAVPTRQNEDLRKLQLTGGSTYVISLPKKWIVQNRLQKSSKLLVRSDEDGSLSVISPDVAREEKSQEANIMVNPKDASDPIIRKTVSAYLVGYNIIRIKAKDGQQLSSRQRASLKGFARDLLVGTEIVTHTPMELTLQVLLSYPELSVQSALRRMSIITVSMHKDAITALQTRDHALAKDVITTDNEVDRFNLYVVRQLKTAIENPRIIREIGLANARDCLGYRLVTKSVERTADHAVNIAENVLLLKKSLETNALKKIIEMSQLAISTFENSIESLFKRNFDLAESSIQRTKEALSFEREAVSAAQKIGADEEANLRLIIESVKRTAEYAADIAEVVLNLTVESAINRQFQER
jgi:phosphate uptake regulator